MTGFTGLVTLSITAGSGTAIATLSGTTAVNAVAGVAEFSTLSIDRSGTGYRFSATASGVSGSTSAPFTVNAGTATRVSFTVQPASGQVATILAGTGGAAIQVTAVDGFGNPDRGYSGGISVSLVTNPSAGTLAGTKTVAPSSAVAYFNDLTIDRSGTGYRLGATAAGLAPDTSDAILISAGPATQLVFSVQPSSANVNTAISPSIRVTALDALGNVASGFSGNVTIAIGANPTGGNLNGTTAVTATNGVAIFSGLNIDKAGAGYTLVAAAVGGGLTPVTSVPFNIN